MSMELKTIGTCGVDSGQLFITDPCYVKHTEQGNGEWNMEWNEGEDGRREYTTLPDPTLESGDKNFYSKVCEANGKSRYGGAEVELGVAFGTTHGDGNYAVQGIFDEDGTMLGIFMDLDGRLEANFSWEDSDEYY